MNSFIGIDLGTSTCYAYGMEPGGKRKDIPDQSCVIMCSITINGIQLYLQVPIRNKHINDPLS